MTPSADMLKSVTLRANGARVTLLNFGATTWDWRMPLGDRDIPMILGFENPETYLTSSLYFGAIAGRVSNRIGSGCYEGPSGRVSLDQNEGETTLHGGANGLSSVFWDLEKLSDTSARLSYASPAGENGFPGNADIVLVVSLTGSSLRYDFSATVDQPTPISLAQHNYYNFGGTPDIWDYQLQCGASQSLAQNEVGVSTGETIDIRSSVMDFTKVSSLAQVKARSLDDHFLFDDAKIHLRAVAEINNAQGLGIRLHSDQLGAQIYTANGMGPVSGGLDGAVYGPAAGICFEPQGHPNAVNIPGFPSVMVTPDAPYQQTLLIETIGFRS